jgi:hypothetical protein
MYCRHCGKEVADDSAFCQYCGGQLHEERKQKNYIMKKFQSLSRGWQICIMCYVVWFLGGACVLIGMGPYGCEDRYCYNFSEILWPILLAVVVLPVIALFFWYYKTHLKKGKTDKTISKSEKRSRKNNSKDKKPEPIKEVVLLAFPLVDFAKKHGEMQVKTVANTTTNEVRSYCIFINKQGNETKVEFDKSLGVLRPQEIVERKEQLVVVQKADGSFELTST